MKKLYKATVITAVMMAVIVGALILSFALAIYTLWFQPIYNAFIESQGRSVGVAETAIGFFILIMFTFAINYYVTRRMG